MDGGRWIGVKLATGGGRREEMGMVGRLFGGGWEGEGAMKAVGRQL